MCHFAHAQFGRLSSHVIPICHFIHKPEMLCIVCTNMRYYLVVARRDREKQRKF